MTNVAVLYGCLLGVLFVSSASGAACTQEKVDQCLAPLVDLEADVNSAVVIYMSEEDLREHCRLYEQFNVCMRDVRPNCGDLDLLVFEGIDDAYHFLCDEAFDQYLEHRECFNNTDLHEEGEYCNQTLSRKLNNLGNSASNDYTRDRICQYANDYLDCVQNAVESFCDTAAGQWQRELDERSLRPLLAELNCPGITYNRDWWRDPESESLSSRFIVAAALVVVTVVILVLVVLMIVMYRRRKLQQQAVQHREARAQQQVHYGPGSGPGGAGGRVVSILPPGWSPGQGAGPLPEKGVMPPPYSNGEPGPFPSGGAIPPPAYSDITVVRGGGANGGGGGASTVGGANRGGSTVDGGYDNPVHVSDDPQYDNDNYTRLGSTYSGN